MDKKELFMKLLHNLDQDDEKANREYTGKHYNEGWMDCYKLVEDAIENMK